MVMVLFFAINREESAQSDKTQMRLQRSTSLQLARMTSPTRVRFRFIAFIMLFRSIFFQYQSHRLVHLEAMYRIEIVNLGM